MVKAIQTTLVVCSLCCSAIMAQDISEQYNLSFEANDVGYEGVPQKWTFPPSPTVSCKITEECPKGAVGKKCLMVDYSNAILGDESRMFMSQLIEIDSTKKYVCSFWLKTEGLTAKGFGVSVGTLYFDENRNDIAPKAYNNRYQVKNVGNLEWEQYQKELCPGTDVQSNDFEPGQIPPNARYVRLFFLSYGYDKKYWIDDLRFEPKRITFGTFVQGDIKIARAIARADNISIDGKLSEGVWMNSSDWNPGFTRTVCAESDAQPVINQTRFKVAQDKQNIFLGVECNSSSIGNIKSKAREHNSMDVFDDEEIEIFLDCSGRRKDLLQIGINASGSFTELFYGTKRNLGLEVATARTSSGWTVEIRIPRDKLWLLYTEAGSGIDKYLWNINVCRHQPVGPAEQRFSSWNYTGNGFGNKSALGVLLFENNEKVLSNRANTVSLQIKTKLQENKRLLNKTHLMAIQKEQSNLFELESFIKDLQRALSSVDVLPDHLFSRYLSEVDAVPERMNNSFQTLQRLFLAFPKEREKCGYMIYEVPLVAQVDSDMYPTKGECKQLMMRIAGDEISSKRFAVFAQKELKDITLKCGALKSKNGAQIPENKIDLRVLDRWGSAHQADILITDERVKLEGYLEKYSEHPRFVTNIPANSTKHFLLQVSASSDLVPGIYEGLIRIEPIGVQATDLPIKVEILPFKLERTDRYVGFFFTGVLFQPKGPAVGGQSFYNGLASESSLKEEFEALSSAGFNFLSIGGYAGGPFNIDYVSKMLEIASEAGIKTMSIQGAEHFITPDAIKSGLNKKSEIYKTLEERISKLAEVAKLKGVELYIYGLDEPNDEMGVLRNNVIFEIAKRCEVHTMTAVIRDDIRKQINGLDVVAMNFSGMSGGDSKLLEMVSRREQVPYRKTTYYANLMANQTPAVRMAYGWYLFKSHMGGNVPWAYYALWQNWKPFADLGKMESENGAYYVFPTKDRPISTLKFEAAREGVNDLRYLEMFEKKLASGKNKQKVREYGIQLEKMLGTFSILNAKDINSENYLVLPKVYDDFRNRIQDMLVELAKEDQGKVR